ncbi:putative membrane lipoprotein [Actinidia rufa]|uniref:Putative membrane lipoprotein n=1 Tax=Actinidia rufa TaxID=165716 RepID=A0A7J0E748_9ERIC|nr:putative membrane lipoprotein [Actinidia rufa]
MGSLSSVGVALSLIFGFLLLALMAELYYLLWWKKNRHNNREIEQEEEEGNCSSPGRDLLHMLCLTKPSSLSCSHTHVHEPQAPFHPHPNKALWPKHGPPRLLFTIKEETMEDLESEDGKSTSRRSFTVETPFLTPLASPPYFTPPLSPVWDSSKTHHGLFNPLFESSPPPNFKILKEAEDVLKMDEENGSFITLIVGNKKERETNNSTISSSQLLPLASNNKPITLQIHQVN